jgi:hypothetical protein
MTVPSETPHSPLVDHTTETIGRPSKARRIPPLDLRIDHDQVPSAATALGVALVSAAVIVSAMNSRAHHHLDGSNFTMGVLGAVGLLGVAVVVRTLFPEAEEWCALVSWPGTAGIIATGLMAAVLINDSPASLYTMSSLIITLSICAYLVTKAASFTLGAIAGSALLYGQAFNDLVDTGGGFDPDQGDSDTFVLIGAAVLVFVLVATVICARLLPGTRILNGVVIGAGGVVAMYFLFQFLTINRYFTSESEVFGDGGEKSPYVNDLWAVLGYCIALALFWLACSLVTGHVGFRILAITITLLAIPTTAYALVVSHPTWWEVVPCAVGGALLMLLVLGARAQRSPQPTADAAQ